MAEDAKPQKGGKPADGEKKGGKPAAKGGKPAPAAAAMRRALADAQINASNLDYLNAHATSTPAGDAAEARVLTDVFGPAVKTVPVSSTKSTTGHLLTAAAAMEALACLVALERGAIPPTINLDDPDPECDPRAVRGHGAGRRDRPRAGAADPVHGLHDQVEGGLRSDRGPGQVRRQPDRSRLLIGPA